MQCTNTKKVEYLRFPTYQDKEHAVIPFCLTIFCKISSFVSWINLKKKTTNIHFTINSQPEYIKPIKGTFTFLLSHSCQTQVWPELMEKKVRHTDNYLRPVRQ